MSATTDAILDNIRVRLPGVSDDAAKLEMFNIIDLLCRDALRQPPPVNVDASPDTWLTSTLFTTNYQCILNGTLARLYMQAGKPWFQAELAKAHFDTFNFQMEQGRAEEASVTTTVYARVISALRVQLPLIRDVQIKSELYAVCDKIRREALRLAPLGDSATDPTTWLSADKWDDCYQALIYGTAWRLMVMVGKPWANPELAKAYVTAYDAEIDLLRGENAATSDTMVARLVNNIRINCGGSRDEVIFNEMFTVVSKIRVEALRMAALTDADSNPLLWLTGIEYAAAYQAILHGTMFRLRLQVGKPYFQGELAKENLGVFETEMDLLRVEDASTPFTIYERLVDNIRVRCIGARDGAIKLELFNAANKLRAEALEMGPLTDSDTTPTTWLPAAMWDDAYNALLHGALFGLRLHAGKPYFNGDLAKESYIAFQQELDLLRVEESGAPVTVYDRLIDALRVNTVMARTAAILTELYHTCDQVRREALHLPLLTNADMVIPVDPATPADPSVPVSWIPADKWSQCYPALFHGTLSRLLLEYQKPYYNAEAAKVHAVAFDRELNTLRAEQVDPEDNLSRLMDNLRTQLPGARDETLKLEMFNAIDDFLEQTNVWREDITVAVTTTKLTYDIIPVGVSTITRLMVGKDADGYPVQSMMREPGVVVLRDPPRANGNFTFTVALTVDDPVDRDGYPEVPEWIMTKYSGAFLDGVLARMMSQIAKPYTSPVMAKVHNDAFTTAISLARVEQERANLFRAQNWRFPQGYATRRH